MKKFMQALRARVKALNIFENNRIFFLIPLVIILITLICGTIFQLSPKYDKFANIGVDFQGGTLLNIEMITNDPNQSVDMNTTNKDYNVEIIRNILEDYGFTMATSQASGESALIVRYSYVAYGNDPTKEAINYGTDEMTATMREINEEIMEDIKTAFTNDSKYVDKDITIDTTASLIGTSSSVRLLRAALIAVSIALAVMFLYIIIRFDIFSALSAIIALMHDVIMMLAFTVIFRVEIGSTIVAGIITIVAYSINNTIVVFDRIRENVLPYKQANQKPDINHIVNDSIMSTFTRTIYTTLTTLITIVILAIVGVSSIRIFALPIIFGLFAGFYSSVFIAAPLWGLFTQAHSGNKNKRANKEFMRKNKQKGRTNTAKI